MLILKKIEIENKQGKTSYVLKKFSPSNQGTCLNHFPDCKCWTKSKHWRCFGRWWFSYDGELALGQNIIGVYDLGWLQL